VRQKLILIWKSKGFRVATVLGTLAFSAGVLGMLIWRQRDLLLSYDWRLRPGYLLLSALFYFLDLVIVAWVWGDIMNFLGARLPFRKHFGYFSIANVAKRLPGTIWYVAGRSQLYNGDGVQIKITSLASGIEFIIALLSSILVGAAFSLQILSQYMFGLWLLSLVFLGGLIVLHPRIFGWILKRMKVDAPPLTYTRLLAWLIAYLVGWVLTGLVVFAIGNAIADLPLASLFFLIGSMCILNLLASALFFAPTNFGLSEIGLSLLWGSIMPVGLAVILAILVRIIITGYEMLAAIACSMWLFPGWRARPRRTTGPNPDSGHPPT